MIDLTPNICRIKGLLTVGDDPSLAYAALECRLAIEAIVYDRLLSAYSHLSNKEIKHYQPGPLIRDLVHLVGEGPFEGATISIRSTLFDPADPPKTLEDYEAMDLALFGTQTGIDSRKVSSLWNALSRLSLHVDVPASNSDLIEFFGDSTAVRLKVGEALAEIVRISEGNAVFGGIGPDVVFSCSCGTEVRRKSEFLRCGQIIFCPNLNCEESFKVKKYEDTFNFPSRTGTLKCKGCDHLLVIPTRRFENIPRDKQLVEECKTCHTKHNIGWRTDLLSHQKVNEPPVIKQ